MKTMLAVLAAGLVAGCAVQRAVVANETREKIVGLSREQVLACMGPPASKAADGATEVWSYNSGNDRTTVNTFGSSTTNA
jgi:outer membrane protein assembly factor BamE (lipoprotein component of BamABCDE complex)